MHVFSTYSGYDIYVNRTTLRPDGGRSLLDRDVLWTLINIMLSARIILVAVMVQG